MTDLPNIVRKKLVQTPPPDHPDSDLLTAFAEQSLGSDESARVLQHLGFCSYCRDVLALAAPEAVLAPAVKPGKAKASIFRWPVLRWAGAAAAVCVVVAAVVTRDSDKATHEASAPQSAAVSSQWTPAPEEKELSDDTLAKVQRLSQSRSNETGQRKKTEQERADKVAAEVPAKQAEPVVPRSVLDARAETQSSPSGSQREMSAQVSFEARTVPAPAAAAGAIYNGSAVGGAVNGQAPAAAREGGMLAKRAPSNMVMSEAAAAQKADESVSFTKAKDSPVMAGALPEFRWSLSASGELQRSSDGHAWTPVTVSQGSVFRALYFSGAEIWAGGNGGGLFHSTDSGAQWTRVTVGGDFAGDIVGIEFTNPQRGRIRTSTGQLWETRDGGQNWQRL